MGALGGSQWDLTCDPVLDFFSPFGAGRSDVFGVAGNKLTAVIINRGIVFPDRCQ